ncbi:hypothetical protein F5887DRAFT_1166312 [Amanita rubescens]|nr:hypothetical protein F5887DRAFT_1166312 [Amanita rubescens]
MSLPCGGDSELDHGNISIPERIDKSSDMNSKQYYANRALIYASLYLEMPVGIRFGSPPIQEEMRTILFLDIEGRTLGTEVPFRSAQVFIRCVPLKNYFVEAFTKQSYAGGTRGSRYHTTCPSLWSSFHVVDQRHVVAEHWQYNPAVPRKRTLNTGLLGHVDLCYGLHEGDVLEGVGSSDELGNEYGSLTMFTFVEEPSRATHVQDFACIAINLESGRSISGPLRLQEPDCSNSALRPRNTTIRFT